MYNFSQIDSKTPTFCILTNLFFTYTISNSLSFSPFYLYIIFSLSKINQYIFLFITIFPFIPQQLPQKQQNNQNDSHKFTIRFIPQQLPTETTNQPK